MEKQNNEKLSDKAFARLALIKSGGCTPALHVDSQGRCRLPNI